jgi:putative transposase
MSEYIHKSHNVSVLLYHYVCPAKYRRVIFDDSVDKVLIQTCQEISKRYDINILELGTDGDHVHFLIQSVPMLAPQQIVRVIKSITAREIYRLCPNVKKKLWGGNIWSAGYFVSTVGKNGNEKQIENYVRNHGKEYSIMYRGQLKLFD